LASSGYALFHWKHARKLDHDWLFHRFYGPLAFSGPFGVPATIVNIYTVHTGKPSNIAILAVMASFAIIFGSLTLYLYIALLKDSEATQTTRTDPA
jgi:hypothetical protein